MIYDINILPANKLDDWFHIHLYTYKYHKSRIIYLRSSSGRIEINDDYPEDRIILQYKQKIRKLGPFCHLQYKLQDEDDLSNISAFTLDNDFYRYGRSKGIEDEMGHLVY